MHNHVRVLILVLGILMASEPVFSGSRGGSMTFLTTGEAGIGEAGVPGARQDAVSRALEAAVQKAIGYLAGPKHPDKVTAGAQILPRALDYVSHYRVMWERTRTDVAVVVGLESQVQMDLVAQALADAGIAVSDDRGPSVLVLIVEQNPGELLPRYWWANNPEVYTSTAESVVLETLDANGIPLLGRGTPRPDPGQYGIRFSGIYDDSAAMGLARALSADVVILGRAGSLPVSDAASDHPQVQVKLTLYDAAAGQEMFSVEARTAIPPDTDVSREMTDSDRFAAALTTAAGQAAEDVLTHLKQYRRTDDGEETRFDVRISGENFFRQYLALENRLQQDPDVIGCLPRETASDYAVLSLRYTGTPEGFASRISAGSDPETLLVVESVSDSLVVVRFAAAAGSVPEKPYVPDPE